MKKSIYPLKLMFFHAAAKKPGYLFNEEAAGQVGPVWPCLRDGGRGECSGRNKEQDGPEQVW